MRKNEALAHAKAAGLAFAHTTYRGIVGVPLGVVGAGSSLIGSAVSLGKGDFKEAGKRIKRVPDKLGGGVMMASAGPMASSADILHHTLNAGGCGLAAMCNKIFGKDKEPKDRTKDESVHRAHERAQTVEFTKEHTQEMSAKVKENTRWMTKSLIKP